jgi:hypothetical protein
LESQNVEARIRGSIQVVYYGCIFFKKYCIGPSQVSHAPAVARYALPQASLRPSGRYYLAQRCWAVSRCDEILVTKSQVWAMSPRRAPFKATLCLLTAYPWAMASAALRTTRRPARPHLVVALVDDLGYSNVGFHNAAQRSPEIDRLATTVLASASRLPSALSGCSCVSLQGSRPACCC